MYLLASIILYISYQFFLILLKEIQDVSLEVTRWKSYSVNKHHLLPSFLSPPPPIICKDEISLQIFNTALKSLSKAFQQSFCVPIALFQHKL